jgi:hypothetical protein
MLPEDEHRGFPHSPVRAALATVGGDAFVRIWNCGVFTASRIIDEKRYRPGAEPRTMPAPA